MKNHRDTQPERDKDHFVCPHCGVVAKQEWTNVDYLSKIVNSILTNLYLEYRTNTTAQRQEVIGKFCDFLTGSLPRIMPRNFIPNQFGFARCQACLNTTVWRGTEVIYPRSQPFPEPNEDLDEGIRKLYYEAAGIYQDSPRAAAALLRLCIEKLCRQLGETGSLNTCIGNLVENGMNTHIQQALDYCRVIGNSAVHAGQIDLEEDPSKVSILFDLVTHVTQSGDRGGLDSTDTRPRKPVSGQKGTSES